MAKVTKLHVELDGAIEHGGASILKDGDPVHNLAGLFIELSAEPEHGGSNQMITLSQLIAMDGAVYRSDVSHTISKATITIEYVEA